MENVTFENILHDMPENVKAHADVSLAGKRLGEVSLSVLQAKIFTAKPEPETNQPTQNLFREVLVRDEEDED